MQSSPNCAVKLIKYTLGDKIMTLPVTTYNHVTGNTTVHTPKPIDLNIGRIRIPLDEKTREWLKNKTHI